jgi:hypothetical protein
MWIGTCEENAVSGHFASVACDDPRPRLVYCEFAAQQKDFGARHNTASGAGKEKTLIFPLV